MNFVSGCILKETQMSTGTTMWYIKFIMSSVKPRVADNEAFWMILTRF